MKTGWKKGLVIGMTLCLAATSAAGCGKKKGGFDTAAEIATLDGEKIEAGLMNFFLRYQQASFESNYGSFLKAYYGNDIWNMDLTGTGQEYGAVFKEQLLEEMEKMLLAEKHAADYSVELTDDEKSAITAAASEFLAANGEEVLEKMSATQGNVERVLTLYTLQQKVEEQMSADVDTEVSDEEAAQRTVSYVRFYAASEDEEDEELIELDEDDIEEVDAAEDETSADAADDGESGETGLAAEAEEDTETVSEAAVTEEDGTKTESADAEDETETSDTAGTEETAQEDGSEAGGAEAAAAEDADEDSSEAAEDSTETLVEEASEAETEDPAVIAAREEARGRAEAFLAVASEVEDAEGFEAAAAEVTGNDSNSYTTSVTFGSDDTYPDPLIIEATEGLEDNTLVDEVIEVSDAYYVIYVTDAFDEEATEEEKESIVEQRKQDAVEALYDEWIDGAEYEIDEALYAELLFDIAFEQETEEATEASSDEAEVISEAAEDVSEAISEAAEDVSEAISGAAEDVSEVISEAAEEMSEAVSEVAEDAEEAVSEAVSE